MAHGNLPSLFVTVVSNDRQKTVLRRNGRQGGMVDRKGKLNGGSGSACNLCGDRRPDSILDNPPYEVAEPRCPACRLGLVHSNCGDSSTTVVCRSLGYPRFSYRPTAIVLEAVVVAAEGLLIAWMAGLHFAAPL